MKYLTRLKAMTDFNEDKKTPKPPTLPTALTAKRAFGSFGSTEGACFQENIPRPLPFLDADGSLVIPFGSDPRFHYWRGGQSISQTEAELRRWKH